MAIDLESETLISLTEAAALVPYRRPHLSALYRWCDAGVRGVRLETARVAGRRVTSRQALQRFFARLNHEEPEAAGAVIDRAGHDAAAARMTARRAAAV